MRSKPDAHICICKVDRSSQWPVWQVLVGLYGIFFVTLVVVVLCIAAMAYRPLLILGIIWLIAALQGMLSYSKQRSLKHTKACAKRYAFFDSVRLRGPLGKSA
jgi:hypothetical protein